MSAFRSEDLRPRRMSINIDGRRTVSVLEEVVWAAMLDICRQTERSLDELCCNAVNRRPGISMSSAIRLFALEYFRERQCVED